MVQKLLIPCMEDLDHSWHSAQVLGVRGKFRNRLSDTPVEQGVKGFLVRLEQMVQFMGTCKNSMVVCTVKDLCTAFIHPEFLLEFLADRAAAVSTGIIVDPLITAGITDLQIEPTGSRAATGDVPDGTPLFPGQAVIVQYPLPCELEDFPDL